MFCPYCRSKIQKDFIYCLNCGREIGSLMADSTDKINDSNKVESVDIEQKVDDIGKSDSIDRHSDKEVRAYVDIETGEKFTFNQNIPITQIDDTQEKKTIDTDKSIDPEKTVKAYNTSKSKNSEVKLKKEGKKEGKKEYFVIDKGLLFILSLIYFSVSFFYFFFVFENKDPSLNIEQSFYNILFHVGVLVLFLILLIDSKKLPIGFKIFWFIVALAVRRPLAIVLLVVFSSFNSNAGSSKLVIALSDILAGYIFLLPAMIYSNYLTISQKSK